MTAADIILIFIGVIDLDWKSDKIRVFQSFFLLCDTKMTLEKWVRTLITSKLETVEIPVGLW